MEDDRHQRAPTTALPGEELDRLRTQVEAALFERDLARSVQRRFDEERSRLEHRIALLQSDRAALRKRLDERERYVAAIHASLAWRTIQCLRGLVGRRW
jgi:ABC-type phosphate transport system auxiliary subunit